MLYFWKQPWIMEAENCQQHLHEKSESSGEACKLWDFQNERLLRKELDPSTFLQGIGRLTPQAAQVSWQSAALQIQGKRFFLLHYGTSNGIEFPLSFTLDGAKKVLIVERLATGHSN